jgi:Ca-activated chloride channel homolog
MATKINALPGIKIILGVILSLALGLMVFSEGKSPTSRLNAEATITAIRVIVRDQQGTLIKNLKMNDFIIREDGRVQPIALFTVQPASPLTIGFVVDMISSETNMLKEEKTASKKFLNKILRPNQDKAFIMQFGDQWINFAGATFILKELTPEELIATIDLWGQQPDTSGTAISPVTHQKRARWSTRSSAFNPATRLSDTIQMASQEIAKQLTARKVLIVLSDGDHIGDGRKSAIEEAQKSGTPIYPIRIIAKGGGRGQKQTAMEKDMRMFANQTGGTYFETGNQGTLEQIYNKIEEELQSQYILGYLTPDKKSRGSFRSISVTVNKKGLIAHAAKGYYYP